jgi:hypothetical protein
MAEHPELWTERTPAPYEATADAVTETDTGPVPKGGRERGPFLTYLCLPWSYGDRERRHLWRRLRCRRRRHEMEGGEIMQLDGAVVFIERRCRWCGADAAQTGLS